MGYKTPQSTFCTVMTEAQGCKSVPYYSSPNLLHEALTYRLSGSINTKPPERLGTDLHDNARWIKQNRFILSGVGNESLDCPNDGFRIYPLTVKCILKNDPHSTCHTSWD